MLRDLYLRGYEDPKYDPNIMEISDSYEAVLNKVRMILLSEQHEVMGEPELGLDLEKHLFTTGVNEYEIKQKFYAQIQKYIPEIKQFNIDLDLRYESDGAKDSAYLIISIDGQEQFGIAI